MATGFLWDVLKYMMTFVTEIEQLMPKMEGRSVKRDKLYRGTFKNEAIYICGMDYLLDQIMCE